MSEEPNADRTRAAARARPSTSEEANAPNRRGEPVRIVCVDDHALLREGLRAQFARDGRLVMVGELESAERLVAETVRLAPGIVLLDIELPGPDIFEIADRLRAISSPPRVVFLTAHRDDACLTAAYRCGASGYFSKSDRPQDIIDGLLEIAGGGGETFVLGPRVRAGRADPRRTGAQDRSADAASTVLSRLSQRELTVLRLIGKGLSRQQIADELCRSVKTIDGHQERLMDKLGVRSRAELIRIAIREGLARA